MRHLGDCNLNHCWCFSRVEKNYALTLERMLTVSPHAPLLRNIIMSIVREALPGAIRDVLRSADPATSASIWALLKSDVGALVADVLQELHEPAETQGDAFEG